MHEGVYLADAPSAKSLQEALRHLAAYGLAAAFGIHSENLDPACGLFEPELTGTNFGKHESDELSVQLGNHLGLWITTHVIANTPLPLIGSVFAANLLVDRDDGSNIELVEGTNQRPLTC